MLGRNERDGGGNPAHCRQHAPGWQFSKHVGFGRGKVRVGLKARPCAFALNRASVRDSPSEQARAKKICHPPATAGGSAPDSLPLSLATSHNKICTSLLLWAIKVRKSQERTMAGFYSSSRN